MKLFVSRVLCAILISKASKLPSNIVSSTSFFKYSFKYSYYGGEMDDEFGAGVPELS